MIIDIYTHIAPKTFLDRMVTLAPKMGNIVNRLLAVKPLSDLDLRFKAMDALSLLARAEYSINGSDWTLVEPTTKVTDAKQHDYEFSSTKPTGSEFTISVRVSDEVDNMQVEKTVLR